MKSQLVNFLFSSLNKRNKKDKAIIEIEKSSMNFEKIYEKGRR